MGQTWRPRVPIWNAVGRGIVYVKITGSFGSLNKYLCNIFGQSQGFDFFSGQRIEVFQLFRKSHHSPRQSPRPGGKSTVTLLSIGAPVLTVVGIENAFMSGPAPYVVRVPVLTIIHRITGCGQSVLDRPLEQVGLLVIFAHQVKSEFVADHQGTDRTDGIDKQGMGPVEGIQITPIGNAGPAPGLNRSG